MAVLRSRQAGLFSILALAAVALMASAVRAGEADPASLKKTSAATESVTAPIVKPASAQVDSADIPTKPAQPPKRLAALQRTASRTFERARSAFSGFCGEWERKLRERERNNLGAIQWKEQNGWKIGQYLGYSRIKTCTCKQSSHGQPVGMLTYGEMNYYLAGKTIDEAKHATPKGTLATETTEIFRWGLNKWEY
jgi:hypothetical protein